MSNFSCVPLSLNVRHARSSTFYHTRRGRHCVSEAASYRHWSGLQRCGGRCALSAGLQASRALHECNTMTLSRTGYFRSPFGTSQFDRRALLKLRKEELPNVGYFQYCVCTPTQMKLTLTGCLFLREMNRFSMPVKNPKFYR